MFLNSNQAIFVTLIIYANGFYLFMRYLIVNNKRFFMKNFSILVFALTLIIALPSYSKPANDKNNFNKLRNRFEKFDKNGDGFLSKSEMMEAHRDRIDKLFTKFDKNSDNKLSRKELRAIRKDLKKKIDKLNVDKG